MKSEKFIPVFLIKKSVIAPISWQYESPHPDNLPFLCIKLCSFQKKQGQAKSKIPPKHVIPIEADAYLNTRDKLNMGMLEIFFKGKMQMNI